MPDPVRDIRILKVPYSQTREERRRAEEAQWRDCCREVDARDKFMCRACGARLCRSLRVIWNRVEHHHVIPISLGGEDISKNVAQLCRACHDARHVTRTLEISGDANDRLLCVESTRQGDVLRRWTSAPPGGR